MDYLFWEMVPSSQQKAAHDADHTHPFMQPGHKESDGERYYMHVVEGQNIGLTVYSPNFTTGEEPTQHPGWWYLAAKVGNARPVYTFKPLPAHTSAGRTAEAMGEWLHGIPGLAKTDPHASFRHAYAIMQGTKPEPKALDQKASMLHFDVPDSTPLLKAFAWGWASHSWSTQWASMPAGFDALRHRHGRVHPAGVSRRPPAEGVRAAGTHDRPRSRGGGHADPVVPPHVHAELPGAGNVV